MSVSEKRLYEHQRRGRVRLWCCSALLWCLCLPFLVQAQTAPHICVTGKNYSVAFEDAALSEKNRQRISSDVAVFFPFATSFDRLKGDEVRAGVFRPSMLPLAAERNGMFIFDHDGKKNIQINKVFSDNYLKKFALMDAHSKDIEKVKDFLSLMNTPDLPSKPMPILRDVYRFWRSSDEPDVSTLSDDDVRAIIEERQQWKYLEVNAMCVGVKEPTRLDDAETLVLFILTTEKTAKAPLDFSLSLLELNNGMWSRGWLP